MKNTFSTSGFLSSNDYCSGLPALMEQYAGRFPGLSYLHLFLGEAKLENDADNGILHYYGDGRCLAIYLTKSTKDKTPSPNEVYEELLEIFDYAVEEHLKKYPGSFFTFNYSR